MTATTPTRFRIRLGASPSPSWAVWFEGATLAVEPNGDTTLEIAIRDQAALHGILARVRDLGLPLLSVMPAEPSAAPTVRRSR